MAGVSATIIAVMVTSATVAPMFHLKDAVPYKDGMKCEHIVTNFDGLRTQRFCIEKKYW